MSPVVTPGISRVTMKAVMPAMPGVGVGFGDDQKVMRFRRQADPHLLAVEDVGVADAPRRRTHVDHVAADARFGQAERGVFLAARLRDEEALFLIFRAPLQQRQAVQAEMHRHDHAQGRIGAFQFFADQPQRDVVEALPAVAHRDADAEDAQFRHARQKGRIHLLLAIPFADDRDDFFGGEIAHHLLCLLVFFVE